MFKQGAFVNILTDDSHEWRAAYKTLEHFPSLDHVELWVEYIPNSDRISEIVSLFRKTEMIVHAPFLHTSLLSHIPEVVALTTRRFDETLDFAAKVSARIVTFHAGSYPLFEERTVALEKLAQRFERFANLTDPIATLENLPAKSYGTTREPLGKLIDCEEILALLPNVRFTLDIGHCIQNSDDFVAFIYKHSTRIENIHLHDGVPHGRGHLRLGTGNLDLNRFLETLKAVHFNKHVSLETISLNDTKSSWKTLCDAEQHTGIRSCDCVPKDNSSLRRRHA